MTKVIERKLQKIPIISAVVLFLKKVKLPWLSGFTLYDLLELYAIGIAEGALSNRAAAIAFSFFMALFPFALFILNLIPYIPIEGFQIDFLEFVANGVPPRTYKAIAVIIEDILNNSHSGLLSTGFLLSVFLMANGVNAILGGFENSKHVVLKRGFISQYVISVGLSLFLSLLLLLTVAIIVVFEVIIQQLTARNLLSDTIPLMIIGRYVFLASMIIITSSVLLKYGTKHQNKRRFFSVGSCFTTFLIILSSYFFGIWVVRFSKYNELYGSIGTLLIIMFYIWINSMILLLGFELNAVIDKLNANNKETVKD